MLTQSVEQLEAAQNNNSSYAKAQDLTTHTGNSTIHVTSSDKSTWNAKADASTLTTHTGDSTIHITSSERTKWNNACLILSYYDGNGESSLYINIGFKPKFGIIYQMDGPIVGYSVVGEQIQPNCGFMSTYGCSQGIQLETYGFRVFHSATGGLDGVATKFNHSGVRYIYVLWK